MIQLLLFVIGCYVIAAAIVHCFYYWGKKKISPHKHYVLIANEPLKELEWHYLSMKRYSQWMGIPVQLTIINATEADESKKMIECWSRQNHFIQLQEYTDVTNAVVVDLNREEDLYKLPF